jgi:repressor LexA
MAAAFKRPRGDTQQKILEFIHTESIKKGYPPSVREIGAAVGLKSTSTVHGHLKRLEAHGLLRRDAMKTRAMEIVSNDPHVLDSKVRDIPLVGKVAAGSPILAEEFYEDRIPLPITMLGEGAHFILAVRGDSMILAGIMDGDYVVVHKQITANNGDIIVAVIDGDATVKRYFRENGIIRLQPEHPTMKPIFPQNINIAGKVISVYRIYK